MSYEQLDILTEKFIDKLPEFLDTFGIDYVEYTGIRYAFPCPIHGGDNDEGASFFTGNSQFIPNWKCYTNHCEEEWGKGPYDFVRAILSLNKDEPVTNGEAIRWLSKFVNYELGSEEEDFDYREKNTLIKSVGVLTKTRCISKSQISRENVRSLLKVPAQYYIDRGYTVETLEKYDVGWCEKYGTPMYKRVVVPVYDDEYKFMVGCLGRTLHPERFGKWKNSPNFDAESYLYNYWFAKAFIENLGTAVLVEGCGDVWRLEEAGIRNSVGLFGTSLSQGQQIALEMSGATDLIIATDNDRAGREAKTKIIEQCKGMFNLYGINIPEGCDVGDIQDPNELRLVFKNVSRIR